ncbi:HDIG domain-containing metalloprotein, partial [Porphyromonas catoniae]
MNPLELIHRYYPEGSDIEHVLRVHSEDVTGLALELADRHPELELDRAFIAEAAMLHDIGIFKTNAPDIYCMGEAPYILHGYLGAELLRELGLPRHAFVAERHTGSGLTDEEIRARGIGLPL